jgi:Tat protein secretion system quality control protein TatD with DNase activity
LSAILTETDAPYQPPRGAPPEGSKGDRRPLLRDHSNFSDLANIVHEIAALRAQSPGAIEAAVEENFTKVFGDGL